MNGRSGARLRACPSSTLLAAWRGLDGFEERATVRARLYPIATKWPLDALRAWFAASSTVARFGLPRALR